MVFIYDLLWHLDHGIIVIHWLVMYLSNAVKEEYNYILAVTAMSILVKSTILLRHDRNLKTSADSVNRTPVEKFVFNKKRHLFAVRDWASIKTGDIIKLE